MLLAAGMAASMASCATKAEIKTDLSSEAESSAASTAESAPEASETDSGRWEPDFSEDPYTVYFEYWVAADFPDQQKVEDELNKLTMDQLNMKVEMLPMTIGAYNSQISMVLAANEPLDLFMARNANHGSYIQSGYVRDWNDYLEYIPDVLDIVGDTIQACYVGDFLIGIPPQKEYGYQSALVVRADVMDALGLKPEDYAADLTDPASLSKVDELLSAVKSAYPDMTVVGGTSGLGSVYGNLVDTLNDGFGVLENFGQTTTVTNYWESDVAKGLAEKSKEWFDAGYYSADAATNQESGTTLMKAGNSFAFFNNSKPNTIVEMTANTGYDVYSIPMTKQVMSSSSTVNVCVYTIANASEDPVKASAFYNWAYTTPEFNDLIQWGVEGVHWEAQEDGTADYPDGITAVNVGYHSDMPAAYLNQFIGHAWTGNPPDIWDQYRAYNSGMLKSKSYGFNFDATSVTDSIAACTSAFEEYNRSIFFGTGDPDALLDALNEKLYASGLQEIMDEKQRQLDEFLASK